MARKYLQINQPGDLGDLETLRRQAQRLEDTSVDINKLSAFAAPEKLDIGDITGAIKPDAGPGLQVSTDLGKLEDGLRKLREQEANARLRRLLDQAQQRMQQNQHHIAISLLDQALEIDQTRASAWLLKGQCYYALREFDQALEMLEQALQRTPDAETRMLTLILRAACEREMSKAVEVKLVELLGAGNLAGAVRLAERSLQEYPGNTLFRYYYCVILMMMNRWAEAKVAITAALDKAGSANVEAFQRLLRQILVAEFRPQLEQVRTYLRKAKPKAAIGVLESCPKELRGEEQFEALRSFAYGRVGLDARVARGLRIPVAQKRMREANVPTLASELLQPLLCWLLQDELQNGVDAMNDDQFSTAQQSFLRAEQIDDRSTVVAYLHAVAILRAIQQDFGRQPPPALDDIEARLSHAAQLAAQAEDDPQMRDQARLVAEVVGKHLQEVDEIRAHIEKVRPVYECVKLFNMLMERYRYRSIASYTELINVKAQLQRLRNDVTALQAQHAASSEEGKVLGQLLAAIVKVQNELS
jgi:tetratricopeptide (TPR) repeat protein